MSTKREQILAYAKENKSATQSEIASAVDTGRGYVSEVLSESYQNHSSIQEVVKKDHIIGYADEHPGSTSRKIASEVEISVTPGYVRKVLQKHRPDYSQREISEEVSLEIRELVTETPPLGINEIAEECDVSRNVVRRIMTEVQR